MNIEPNFIETNLNRSSIMESGNSNTGSFDGALKKEEVGTLSTITTVLAIMSTIVGGGMVSIPWAFYNTGFYLAIFISIFASAQVILSSILFLKARDLCPGKPTSMFELGFILLGRSSIFWITSIILVNSLGLLIIFFNVFGDTVKDAMTQAFWGHVPEDYTNFGMTRACWVLVLAAVIIPFVFQKELAELKGLSVGLFISALIFVATNVFQILIRGTEGKNPDIDKEYGKPRFGKEFIQSMAIIFTACNFQVNLFPIHSNQKDKSLKASIKSQLIAMILVQGIYCTLATVGITMYGSSVESSILGNIGSSQYSLHWETYFMQGIFAILLACHIPYLFFSGKEALLIIIDEIMNKSISQQLESSLGHNEILVEVKDPLILNLSEDKDGPMERQTYKNMNPAFYIGLTLALYAVEIYLAIVVQDIGDIFGFIGTIGGTSLSFFIPSVLYFRACDKFGKNESKTLYNFAIVNFLMGIIFFGLLLFSNILSLKKD